MKLRFMMAVVLALAILAAPAALAQQKTVTVMGVWGGQELEAFEKVLEPFEAATGIDVQFIGTRDLPTLLTTRLQAGNPPDIALINPGLAEDLSRQGALVGLEDVLDMNRLRNEYAEVWIDLGTYDGELKAIFISADLKSLVWYNPKAFAEKGYTVPQTWDELIALSDRIVADGGKPWSIGLESDAASGWPGTDWIEDIMLRTAGPDVYDQWVRHEIPWTHPDVRRAFEIFGQIARNPDYLYGGIIGTLATNFGDSVHAIVTDPPNAYMHRQATFIQSFIHEFNPNLVPGEDYDFFALPPIDERWGVPAMGAADMVSMLNDTPEARALMRYLASAGAQQIWVSELGKLSANRRLNPNAYPNDLARKAAEILVQAEVFRFDGSDSMPGAVGGGAFWTGILDYVSGQSLDDVLEMIEAAAQDAY